MTPMWDDDALDDFWIALAVGTRGREGGRTTTSRRADARGDARGE